MGNRSGAVSQAALGYQGDAAVDSSKFNTEVACTDRILLSSGNPKTTVDAVRDDSLTGDLGQGTPSPGLEKSEDSISAYVPYTYKNTNGLVSSDTLIASMMGATSFDAVNNTWRYTFADLSLPTLTIGYIFGTVSAGQLRTAIGFLPTTMELSCELTTGNGAKLAVKLDGVCYGTFNTSSVNTKTGIDGIPHIGYKNIMATQMRCFLSDNLGVTLSDSDRKMIKKFTIKVDRPLDTDGYGTATTTHTDSKKILLPLVNGKRMVTMTLEIPRYDSEEYKNWEINHTMLQGKITFTDSTDEFNIYIPNIYVETVDSPLDSADTLKQTVNCILSRRDSSQLADGIMTFADGTTNIDDEFNIETKNDRTTSDNPL